MPPAAHPIKNLKVQGTGEEVTFFRDEITWDEKAEPAYLRHSRKNWTSQERIDREKLWRSLAPEGLLTLPGAEVVEDLARPVDAA